MLQKSPSVGQILAKFYCYLINFHKSILSAKNLNASNILSTSNNMYLDPFAHQKLKLFYFRQLIEI